MSKKETVLHSLIWIAGILILMYNPFFKLKINSNTFHFLHVSLNIILTYVLALYFLPKILSNYSIKQLCYGLLFYLFISFCESILAFIARDFEKMTWLFKGIIANAITNSFFLAIAFVISLSRLWYQKNVLSQTLLNEKLKAELSFLNAQVNPHFMFNSLNTIYGLAIKESAAKTQDATQKLSELFRYMLENSTKETIPFEKEINYVNAFIQFQRLRLPENADISFDYTLSEEINMPPFILIPMVENAFKYAVGFNTNIYIKIDISMTKTEFRFTVVNSINQTREELQESSTGIGLDNLKKRLALHFKNDYTLTAKEENGQYFSELFIKMHNR